VRSPNSNPCMPIDLFAYFIGFDICAWFGL
jgi:hypothetical protein